MNLQFSGGLRVNFHYRYSFLVILTRIQLQEIIPLRDFLFFVL